MSGVRKYKKNTLSPMQQRQRDLFTAKGSFTSITILCERLMWNVQLTPKLRDCAHRAMLELRSACDMFDEEVGWGKGKREM